VQTGFGRTGAMFASERYGITPDILVSAKSIADGLPLAAVTGRAEIMDAPGLGGLGGTYGGNPLACAAALAVIETLERESLPARADRIGARFDTRAREWQKRWPLIGDVRGLGAMRALELVRPGTTREPAKEETERVLQHCFEHGLILVSAGSYGNVIRLLMPLVITDDQFDEGLQVLEGALMHVAESVETAPRHG
jgi:4-aminobutyrate aminotransferase / (S)-3-amino-2-methylpropionate transaminase / 5-aminovalerate transaminase